MKRRIRYGLAAIAMLVATACAVRPIPPTEPTFAASVARQQGAVYQVNSSNGHLQRKLLSATQGRYTVSGLAQLGAGRLLVTYGKGPDCGGNIAGCGPRPGTCGGEIDALTIATGALETLWRVGNDTYIRGATPSPDGKQVAALVAPCVPSYFNNHLMVRDLRSGAVWTAGAGLPRCHDLSAPAWAPDGQHLLVSYGPAAGAPYQGPDGTCTEPSVSGLLEIPAHLTQPGLTGTFLPPWPDCTYRSVATGANRMYAVEACGHLHGTTEGPVSLIRFDTGLRALSSWSLGKCSDGDNIVVNPHGEVLTSVYLYCGEGSFGVAPADPLTVVSRLAGNQLSRVATYPGGNLALDTMAW